jgi:hypothetical protein
MMKYTLDERTYLAVMGLKNRLKDYDKDIGEYYQILWMDYLAPYGHYSVQTMGHLPVIAIAKRVFRLLLDNKTFWKKCQIEFKYTDRKQLMTYLDLGFDPDESFFLLVPKEALASAVTTLLKNSEVE